MYKQILKICKISSAKIQKLSNLSSWPVQFRYAIPISKLYKQRPGGRYGKLKLNPQEKANPPPSYKTHMPQKFHKKNGTILRGSLTIKTRKIESR
jgi:hypothetical protein